MQIIIPMSGYGERFKKAGYKVPKPLIEVDGKPIIQHVVEMFPGEKKFFFICNKNHLKNKKYKIKKKIKQIAPNAKIIAINPHKLGPVHAVLESSEYLDDKEPTIVNYADFTCFWNYKKFKKTVLDSKCDGAIPCYKSFHPHTIWSNYYAYVKEKNLKALDIQEKQPFTKNPQMEFASSGTYYFKNGNLMKEYFKKTVKEKLLVNNEYYVSMVYQPMIKDNLNIKIFEINHFMQWGTPQDLEDYIYWSNCFKNLIKKRTSIKHKGTLLLPMVGVGKRFSSEGYKTPKPLIQVSGKSLAEQAINDLPKTTKKRIILRRKMLGINNFKKTINKQRKKVEFIELNSVTDGQATTCIIGSKNIPLNTSVTIAACDNGMIYDDKKFDTLYKNNNIDVIVWGIRGYPGAIRNPNFYGWINLKKNSNKILNISVKKPLKNPKTDPIVIGTFTYKKLDDFKNSVEKMKNRNAKVNNEYYVDTAINDSIALGLNCVFFEIKSFLCWGTPNDLKTFNYWQACFHKWNSHPYKLHKDKRVYKSNKINNEFL